MSDYELLKTTKTSYNSINEILCNYDLKISSKKIDKLENIKNILSELYNTAYLNIENNKSKKEQLLTTACCKDCSKQLLISDNIEYSYQCIECNENYYDFETISNEVWYEEEKKENLELPSSFDLNIVFDKDEKLMYIGTESSSGTKYKCNNTNDLIKNIEMYCDNYLILDEEKEAEIW